MNSLLEILVFYNLEEGLFISVAFLEDVVFFVNSVAYAPDSLVTHIFDFDFVFYQLEKGFVKKALVDLDF